MKKNLMVRMMDERRKRGRTSDKYREKVEDRQTEADKERRRRKQTTAQCGGRQLSRNGRMIVSLGAMVVCCC